MNSPSAKSLHLARTSILVLAVIAIFAGSHFLRLWLHSHRDTALPAPVVNQSYERIIALSPSSAEVVYQLGLDDRLVGVSRFCKFPADAANKPIVGGYLDLDFETVLKLQPDCVILLNEQQALAKRLNDLNIKTISVDHASTEGILSSIHAIGAPFGKISEAEKINSQLQKRIDTVIARGKKSDTKPRVLVCISRDTTSSQPDRIIAAGNAGVHQEYITMAGGTNAYQGSIAYPAISREKLLQLNPDIIIELISEDVWKDLGRTKLLQQWAVYSELQAAQNQRIIFLHENKHVIPGPRFVDTLEAFSRAIHPAQP